VADFFIGEIRVFAGNFAPTGWALCNGQLLPISQNTALFSLLGTFYGGDGKSNFALPDLRDSAPLGMGQGSGLTNRVIGDRGGSRQVTLTASQMPAHSHSPGASSGVGSRSSPVGGVWAVPGVLRQSARMYRAGAPDASMSAQVLGSAGLGQAHNNAPPYLGLTFIIALQGIFPSRP
jgi:microcystin-dependent protein